MCLVLQGFQAIFGFAAGSAAGSNQAACTVWCAAWAGLQLTCAVPQSPPDVAGVARQRRALWPFFIVLISSFICSRLCAWPVLRSTPNWAGRDLVVNGEGSGPGPDAVFWVWPEAGHVLRGRGNTGTDAMGNAVHAISRRLPLWSRRGWSHEVHAAPGF